MTDFDPPDVARTVRDLRTTVDSIDRGDVDIPSIRSQLETAAIQLESFTKGNPP